MDLILVLFVTAILIAPLIALIYAVSRVRALQRAVNDLSVRLELDERQLRVMQEGAAGAKPEPAPHRVEPPPVAATRAPVPDVKPAPVVAPEPPEPARPPGPVAPPASVLSPRPPGPVARPEPVLPPEPVMPAIPAPSEGSLQTWEATFGGSWLSRIGVTMLVLGITFALGYTLTQVGPLGKSLLAAGVSLGMIIGGILLSGREKYGYYARGLIGGGWAALYATAYAVHELDATRIIESRFAGFLLLMLVGVGMIVHSLRYRNQGLTTIAYGLAYAAIVLHSISAYTLAAATLLGLGTMLHLLRREWYGVAFGGVAATYGSLFLWYLRQKPLTMETLYIGMTALAIQWAVFIVADFAPDPGEAAARIKRRALGLLNASLAGSLAWVAWERTSPPTAWLPPLVLGSIYVVTSVVLRRRGRVVTHQMHSLVAALLLAIAAGQGLRFETALWIWLLEAQAVVAIGLACKDLFHRRLGSVLFLLPMAGILLDQIGFRAAQIDGVLDWERLLISAAACGCFYFTYAKLASLETERIRQAFNYGAFALIVVSTWVHLPEVWVAPALSLFFVLLFEASARYRLRELRVQAWIAVLVASMAAVGFSIPSGEMIGYWPARSPALAILAVSFMLGFLRMTDDRRILDDEGTLRAALPWAGALAAAAAVWLDARPTLVGPLWLILALLLVESGLGLREVHLRRPGFVLLLGADVSLLMSNIMDTSGMLGLSVRTATLVPAIAANYYLWWRLRQVPSDAGAGGDDWDERYGRLLSYVAAGLAGLYVRFQFGLDGAAMRWSLAMIVLMYAGYRLADADLRIQAYALAAAVFVRATGIDFQRAGPVLGIDGAFAVAAVCSAAYLAAGFYLRSRRPFDDEDRRSLELERQLAPHGVDIMWLAAVVMTAFYLFRTQSGSALIVAWAVEGLVVSAGGFAFRTMSLRLAGLGLLGLAIVLAVVRAFTTFDMIGRIITFTVLGVVLLLVSFGYTRFREWFRRAS